jgi:DnaK suppressor protein
MQTSKLQYYRERLLDERRQLIHETERILESIPEEVHPPGEHEIAPSEGIDVEMSLEKGDAARLREIDAALQRIHQGTYGQCLKCGIEISPSRLEAAPDARYCMRCETTLGRS